MLVVEDDTRLAGTLQRGLEAEGFAVDVAHNGTDGHWMATSFDYDLILLDIMLPGMDAWRSAGSCGPASRRRKSRSSC